MIPPLIAETPSLESAPIPFDESDASAMLMLEYLKDMYIGKEHPFLTSSRDGFTYLIIPRTITRVFNDADTLTDKTARALWLSNGEGAVNG